MSSQGLHGVLPDDKMIVSVDNLSQFVSEHGEEAAAQTNLTPTQRTRNIERSLCDHP